MNAATLLLREKELNRSNLDAAIAAGNRGLEAAMRLAAHFAYCCRFGLHQEPAICLGGCGRRLHRCAPRAIMVVLSDSNPTVTFGGFCSRCGRGDDDAVYQRAQPLLREANLRVIDPNIITAPGLA